MKIGFKLSFVSLLVLFCLKPAFGQVSQEQYTDTEFGELLYSEATIATRLEMLELLSKNTPSTLVFLHAISMGLGIEDILEAAVQYEPDRSRDLAESAISLLPLLETSENYNYTGYELEDLQRNNDSQLYSIKEVADRFFEDRQTLELRPDWSEGQYHFLASVKELRALKSNKTDHDWYFQRNKFESQNRPIFVSLYESDKSIQIDGEERLLMADDEDTVPVVFIYNQQREQSIDYFVDELKYERSIKGVVQAYSQDSLMLTPTPEWRMGEYHIYAELDEVDEFFDIPDEEDFEPEHWQKMLLKAEEYKKSEPAFIIAILRGGQEVTKANDYSRYQYAAYTDPRAAQEFPYIETGEDENLSLTSIINRGLILNRPDLIAALKAIGVARVPIVFYYIDDARTKPYRRGPKALRLFISGLPRLGVPGGGGGFGPPPICASPPCISQ